VGKMRDLSQNSHGPSLSCEELVTLTFQSHSCVWVSPALV